MSASSFIEVKPTLTGKELQEVVIKDLRKQAESSAGAFMDEYVEYLAKKTVEA
jgi:predicted oxidoreductase